MAQPTPPSSKESNSGFVLQCPLCSHLKTLKLLHCFHTFCAECLNDPARKFDHLVARAHRDKRQAAAPDAPGCPTCKKPIIVPGHDANNLPDVTCSFLKVPDDCMCELEKATDVCVTCFEFLGEKCVRAHRKGRLTAQHEIRTLDQWKASGQHESFDHRSNGWCRDHKSREATFYCNTCKCAICNNCQQLKHTPKDEHSIVDLEDRAREAEQQLARYVEGLYKNVCNIQGQISISDETKSSHTKNKIAKEKEIKEASDKAREDLRKKFLDDMRDITKKEEGALQQCVDSEAAATEKINLRRSHCTSKKEKLWGLTIDVAETCQTSSLADMIACAEEVKGDTKVLPETTLPMTLPPAPSFDILIQRHKAEETRDKIKDFLNRSHDYDNRAFSTTWVTECQAFIDGETNIPPGPAQPPDTSRPLDAMTELTFLRLEDSVKLCEALGGHPDVHVADYIAGAAVIDGQEKVLACRAVLKDREERDLEVQDGSKSCTCFLPAEDSLYSAVGMYLGRRPSRLNGFRTKRELQDERVKDWYVRHACEAVIVMD